MKIKRTYNFKSRKNGQTEIVDESKAREVFAQTDVAFHHKKQGYTCCKCPDPPKPCTCGRRACFYCAEPAMEKLLAGGTVETYFSSWQLAEV
jgi:hypothetical protein